MRVLITLLTIFIISPLTHADAYRERSSQVEIRRTAYGIPHILAETEQAASFGLAWAQCEDHFPLVYKAMVRGRSEMSLRYGASESNIQFDFQTLQLRARKHVVDTFHTLPRDYRDTVAGFAQGINAYMEAHPDEVEPWMTPVTPHDVAAAWEIAVMRFTFLRDDVLGRFKAEILNKNATDQPEAANPTQNVGSNAIALAPSRTTSGHAMLLSNPHQPWSEAAWFYEAHITVPGVVNFYGGTFVGSHLLTMGFNDSLGWTHTTNAPDLVELYQVPLDPADPTRYLFDGGSIPMEHERVSIQLDDGTTQSMDMRWSPLGPVIHTDEASAYILRAAGYGRPYSGLQWFRMARAQDLDAFRTILEMQAIPMFNIVYADKAGNIFYIWNGAVPDLPHARQEFTPVIARSSDDVWMSFHALDELMQLTNPRGGYVQNCNSPPYFTNLYEPLRRDSYPAHFPDNDLSLRTQHGLALVHNDRKFSLDDLVDAKHSMDMWLAHRVKDDLVTVLAEADLTEAEHEALTLIKAWDNTAGPDSVGSVVFEAWWETYRQGGPEFADAWSEADPMATPAGLASPERAVDAFREAVAETSQRWGRLDIPWGEVHRIRRGSQDMAVGGGSWRLGCFRVCHFDEAEDGKRVMNGGDGFVFAVEFGETPRAYSVLAYGQSGRPESPHYADQVELFCSNRMKPVAFTEAAIGQQLLRAYRPRLD